MCNSNNWYVLVEGEIKADNLKKKAAFDICQQFHTKHPNTDASRILMCRKIKRKGKEMYSKACYLDFETC